MFVVVALWVIVLTPIPSWAQEGEPTPKAAAAEQEPPASVLSELEVASLEARLAAIESSDSYDAAQKSVLLSLYNSAIDALNSANVDRARAEEFRKLLINSAAELEALAAAAQEVDLNPAPPQLASLSNEELRLRRSYEQSLLSSLRSELQEREAEIELLRNERPQLRLAAAQAELAEMESITPASSGAIDPATFEARSVLQSARRLSLRARINLLDQKRISFEARQALASTAADLVNDKIQRSEAIVAYLEEEAFNRRAARADGSLEETEMLAQSLDAVPPAMMEYLEENRRLSGVLAQRQQAINRISDTNAMREGDLERLKKAYTTLTEQLRVAGFNISPSLAIALRKEREQLSQLVSRLAVPGPEIQQQIIDARLEEIQLDAQLAEDRDAIVHRLVTGPNGPESGQLTDFASTVVADRLRIAADLQAVTGDYVAALGRSQSAINNLRIVFAKYRELVDELLFWVPSAAVVRADSLQLLADGLLAEVTSGQPLELARNAGTVFRAHPLQGFGLLVLFVLLVGVRPRLRAALVRSGEHVGKVQSDRFRDSLWALCLTFLLSVPAPAFFLLLSVAVRATGLYLPIASGLEGAALASFVLGFFYHVCCPAGLGEQHFKWPESLLLSLRKHMRWYLCIAVPCTVVTAATAQRYGFVLSDMLGIIAYVLLALATASLIHCTLRPFGAREVTANAAAEPPQSKTVPATQWLIYAVGVGLPVVLAALALNGFYYTSAQLQIRFFLSLTVAAGGVVVFFLAVRLLAISERRLRFKQILEERRAARERQDDQEWVAQSGEAVPELLDLGQLDVETVGAQTRSIARLAVFLGCAAIMWSIWSSLLPALGVFEDVVLWQVNTGAGDAVELKNITLQHLLMAVFVIGVTVLATRNLPGLIDMIVLSRLEVEPGTNYAITSILNYFLVFTGLVVVCYLLGVQWSKLQWLVAALGVGLGFGLQEIVANFVSGLLILFERPIRVGDTITIGDEIGTVTKIRIRATTVLDWDRKEQIIPNKTFVTEQLTNWTLSDPITRMILRVGVSYNSDVEQVHALITGVVQSHERVLATPPPSVFFTGFGDSSLDFEARVFVSRVIDLYPMRHELNVAVFKTLKENGIEIPFPQRDLHLRSSDLGAGPAN